MEGEGRRGSGGYNVEAGVTSRPGKGGHRDWGVGLVEKPWPDLWEFWVFIPSLPLTCCVTLGPTSPWASVSTSYRHTVRSSE